MIKFGLLFLSVVLACQAVTDEQVASEWKVFLERSQKTYKSPTEVAKRLSIFRENLEKIEAHNELYNKGESTFKMGVTQFSDWTSEEFLEYVGKFKMIPKKSENVFMPSPNYTALTDIDWRNQGAVTGVKNQGQCGSCWSFSATGALEGQAALRRGQRLVLSEQNLVDCAGSNYNCYGCNGGFMDGAFQYASDNGLDSEQNYPYRAVQGSCNQRNTVLQSNGYSDVGGGEGGLQQAVEQIGPIAIGIDATSYMQQYSGGILNDPTCTGSINHGVLLVGHGSSGGSYWIIKNSWGDYWGEQGYFRLVKGRAACGITSMASYPRL